MDNGEKTQDLPKPRPVSPINGQPVPNGRKKGVPNKATMRFKDALNELFETAAPEMVDWLNQIDNPKERFDVLSKFANYIFPQLSRQDVQTLDKDGKPADAPSISLILQSVDGKTAGLPKNED